MTCSRIARGQTPRLASLPLLVAQVLNKDHRMREMEEGAQAREAELEKKVQEQQDAQRSSMATLQQQISSYK